MLRLGGEGSGGEIHGPEHQAGGGEVDSSRVDDSADFGTVQGEVATVHGHANPRDAGQAASTGHVVEAGASVEVMAAAGASSDGWAVTLVAAGKSVAAETDDQVRLHRDLRGVKRSE